MLEIIFVCEINFLSLESTDIFTKMQLFSTDFCSISAQHTQRSLLRQAACTCELMDALKELEALHSDRWPRKTFSHNQSYGNVHQRKQNKKGRVPFQTLAYAISANILHSAFVAALPRPADVFFLPILINELNLFTHWRRNLCFFN